MDLNTRRSTTLLVWCAAACTGLLFAYPSSARGWVGPLPGTPVTDYLPYLVPAAVLVLWRLRPERTGAWALVVGAAGAMLGLIPRLVPVDPEPWIAQVLGLVGVLTPPCALIGLLAVATALWQEGRQTAGAVLVGAAMVAQPLGGVFARSVFGFENTSVLDALTLAVVVLALVGAVAAVRLSGDLPAVAPAGWTVIAAGGAVAATPALYQVVIPSLDGIDAAFHLRFGLLFLAIGVVGGLVAGRRVLVGGAAVGLLLGAFGSLVSPSVEVLQDMAWVAAVAAVGSLATGCLVALSSARTWIGAGGLGVAAAGLLVIHTLFAGDDPLSSYDGFTRALTPILLVIGVAAAVAAVASVASALAPAGETPAALAGVATAFAIASLHVTAYFTLTTAEDKARLVGILPPVVVSLLVAAGLVLLLQRAMRATPSSMRSSPNTKSASGSSSGL